MKDEQLNKAAIEPVQRTAAKIVGWLYLIQMATGMFGQAFVRDSLIVAGNHGQDGGEHPGS
jgi:hypothetical protein